MEFKFKSYNADTIIEFTLNIPTIGKFDALYVDSYIKFCDNDMTIEEVAEQLKDFTDFHHYTLIDAGKFFDNCENDDEIYDKWQGVCSIVRALDDLSTTIDIALDKFRIFDELYYHSCEAHEYLDKMQTIYKIVCCIQYTLEIIDLPDGF